MSRYCGEWDTSAVLNAAALWREKALWADGSVFSAEGLWSLENLKSLETYCGRVQDKDKDKTFIDKLKIQLASAPAAAKQLAAEMNWLLLLCPSNISVGKKREIVSEIWRWSGAEIPPSAGAELTPEVLQGIGSAGTGYNTFRWRELVFCLDVSIAFKTLPAAERDILLADGWKFSAWLASVPGSEVRQFRHMLLFLLFPDDFERIFGQKNRHEIAAAFAQKTPAEIRRLSPLELDEIFRGLRTGLEDEYQTSSLDYYLSPLVEYWVKPVPATLPRPHSATTGVGLAAKEVQSDYVAEAGDGGEYALDQAVDGLFIDHADFTRIVELLRAKKNLILQGPPGVGKTFFSRRLAYALMNSPAQDRFAMVQFHPSYAYEDFVQGYRPTGTGFERRDGPFYRFCELARQNLDEDFVFVIDEINRSNLNKVFGELMMLIEVDKRAAEWAIPLMYSREDEFPFHVPPNVHLLALMNTADRSLALVDYALRRRFAFVDVAPGFATPQFSTFLLRKSATRALVSKIVRDMTALNEEITKDRSNLGPGYCVGHSFFCTGMSDVGATPEWYREVIVSEIMPLLREYWFDDVPKSLEWERRLLDE